MPVDYLTEEQEQRYGRYVGEPSPEQLARYFHLDDEDRLLIAQRRGDYNRLGFGIQIGTLRFLGTFLTDPVNVPVGVIAYVASQLGIANPQCIVRYAERIQTQQNHAQEIRQHYSYKEFSDRRGGFALLRFLYARAWVGTERPSVLFDLATAWLLDKKVLLPGVTTLTRLIASIRERVAERLWQRLSAVVSPEQRTDLEGLLARTGTSRISNLERLRRAPSRASAPVLVQALARLTEVRHVASTDKPIDRRYYTLCVLERLHDALRRHDVFVDERTHRGDPRAKLFGRRTMGASPTHHLSIIRKKG